MCMQQPLSMLQLASHKQHYNVFFFKFIYFASVMWTSTVWHHNAEDISFKRHRILRIVYGPHQVDARNHFDAPYF
jgi:hypothetical protein